MGGGRGWRVVVGGRLSVVVLVGGGWIRSIGSSPMKVSPWKLPYGTTAHHPPTTHPPTYHRHTTHPPTHPPTTTHHPPPFTQRWGRQVSATIKSTKNLPERLLDDGGETTNPFLSRPRCRKGIRNLLRSIQKVDAQIDDTNSEKICPK